MRLDKGDKVASMSVIIDDPANAVADAEAEAQMALDNGEPMEAEEPEEEETPRKKGRKGE